MATLHEQRDAVLGAIGAVAPRQGGEPGWLNARREAARDAFAARGLPHHVRKEERYRFLPTAPLVGHPWTAAAPGTSAAVPDEIAAMVAAEAQRLVLVDGFVDLGASRRHAQDGVRLLSLAEALQAAPELLEAHLAQHATHYGDDPFAAIQTASFADAVVLHVAAGVQAQRPIHVAVEASGAPVTSHPRLLVVCEDGAAAELIETFHGPDGVAYLTNAVAEFVIGAGAMLHHSKVVLEGDQALHVAAGEFRHSGDGGTLVSHTITLGGALGRHDLNVRLGGRQVESTLNGLYLLGERQVVDHHTRIEHMAPDTTSHELFKGVLDGHAKAVFNGRIYVDQAAQKTDAYQSNPNLLLSDDVVANSNPELEIYADDVKCSHGATYGDLDEQALFYLESRGFNRASAEEMLVVAFASDIVERLAHEPLREALHRQINARLAAGRAWAEVA